MKLSTTFLVKDAKNNEPWRTAHRDHESDKYLTLAPR